jgi:hypothetical protein
MSQTQWIGVFMVLGLLVAAQSFAGQASIETLPSRGVTDPHSLAMYDEEQAQLNKIKAQFWDFQADYYQKFPSAYSGKSTVTEHVVRLCAIAEDFRKDAKCNEELAAKHRSLMQ